MAHIYPPFHGPCWFGFPALARYERILERGYVAEWAKADPKRRIDHLRALWRQQGPHV